jgi:hypothetical protein
LTSATGVVTQADSHLLSQITGRLDPQYFQSEAITDAPGSWAGQTPTGSIWVDLDVSGELPQQNTLTEWEGYLLMGAYRDLAASQGANPLGGASIQFVDPAGAPVNGGVGSSNNPTLPGRQVTPVTDQAAAQSQISDAVFQLGWKLDSVRFLQPDGIAPVVVVTTPDGSARPDIRSILGPDALNWDGYYLQVRDAAGNTLLVNAYMARLDGGITWHADANQPATRPDGMPKW